MLPVTGSISISIYIGWDRTVKRAAGINYYFSIFSQLYCHISFEKYQMEMVN